MALTLCLHTKGGFLQLAYNSWFFSSRFKTELHIDAGVFLPAGLGYAHSRWECLIGKFMYS